MKHQRSQYQSDCRSGLSILALLLVFFVLPYITDVPYLDDQAPTQVAEENSKLEGKAEADYDNTFTAIPDAQNDSVAGNGLTSQDIYKRISCPIKGTPSSQCLLLALLVSRPPPGA